MSLAEIKAMEQVSDSTTHQSLRDNSSFARTERLRSEPDATVATAKEDNSTSGQVEGLNFAKSAAPIFGTYPDQQSDRNGNQYHGTKRSVAAMKGLSEAASSSQNHSALQIDNTANGTQSTIIPSPKQVDAFVRPLRIFGKLISTPDSFLNLTINLVHRLNSFGRSGVCTVKHPDGNETRIPKVAFKVIFWKEDYRFDAKAGKSWREMDNMLTMIVTEAKRGIFVNGVKLMPSYKDDNQDMQKVICGTLYDGDIITVYEEHSGKARGVLKFTFESSWGESAKKRPAEGLPFQPWECDIQATQCSAQSSMNLNL